MCALRYISLSIYLSIYLLSIYTSIYTSIFHSFYLSFFLSIHLFYLLKMYISLSFSLSIYLPLSTRSPANLSLVWVCSVRSLPGLVCLHSANLASMCSATDLSRQSPLLTIITLYYGWPQPPTLSVCYSSAVEREREKERERKRERVREERRKDIKKEFFALH